MHREIGAIVSHALKGLNKLNPKLAAAAIKKEYFISFIQMYDKNNVYKGECYLIDAQQPMIYDDINLYKQYTMYLHEEICGK